MLALVYSDLPLQHQDIGFQHFTFSFQFQEWLTGDILKCATGSGKPHHHHTESFLERFLGGARWKSCGHS
jgi:hypothetical protein